MINWIRKSIYLLVLIGFSTANAGSYDDFFQAIDRNNVRAVEQLLERGIDPNTPNPAGVPALMLALKLPTPAIAAALLARPDIRVEVRNAQDESPLMLAALVGELEICQTLIERDADVNKPGWTPLHYAATNSHIPVIQLLLDHHAYIATRR